MRASRNIKCDFDYLALSKAFCSELGCKCELAAKEECFCTFLEASYAIR